MRTLLVHPGFPDPFIGICRVLDRGKTLSSHIPLGLVTIASMFPKEWPVRLRDLIFEDISDQDWAETDLVAVTGMCVQDKHIVKVIREAKKRGKTVLAGGSWVSHFPDHALHEGADLVVKGEAELIFDQVLERLRTKEFGSVISTEEKTDMKLVPLPRFDLLDMERYLCMSVQFSRGCPFRCEFCDVTNLMGRKVRSKTPDQVLTELDLLYNLGWRQRVIFSDDNFIGVPTRAKTLLKQMIPWMESKTRPFDFFAQVSANVASDDELLDLLFRADFWQVCVGIETTDPDVLKRAGKLQNIALDLDKVCEKITEAGLTMLASFMIGCDDEKPGVDRRVIDFATRNRIPEVFLFPLRATPGTDLWNRLEREGRLLPDSSVSIGHEPTLMNFVTKRPKPEIARETIYFYETAYDPIAFLERAVSLFDAMKPTNGAKSTRRIHRGAIQWVLISLYRQGAVYSSRWKFWKLFFKTLIRFPTRFRHFLFYSTMGVVSYEYFQNLISELHLEIQHMEGEGTSDAVERSYEYSERGLTAYK
jgi:radical SAM superfamily enzyme YgiQ (UPF0313 family)